MSVAYNLHMHQLNVKTIIIIFHIILANKLIHTESSPRSSGPTSGDDWRSAFDAAANSPSDLSSRYGSGGHSRRYSDPSQNGDVSSGSNSGSRRTPTRLPPAPPQSGSRY